MKLASIFVFGSALILSACSTFQGLKNDLASGYDSITNTVAGIAAPDPNAARKKMPVYDGQCPPVSVRPDLKRLVEFTDEAKPTDSTKMSEVTINGVTNTCRVENGMIVMQIDIALYGQTGPKARVKATDKPSFAYPYFIAVTDQTGNVVSKEIFAASLAYAANQKDINQTESVFQNMPIPDKDAGQNFNVIVGLQLTPEQLAYNQNISAGAPVPPLKPAAAVN